MTTSQLENMLASLPGELSQFKFLAFVFGAGVLCLHVCTIRCCVAAPLVSLAIPAM